MAKLAMSKSDKDWELGLSHLVVRSISGAITTSFQGPAEHLEPGIPVEVADLQTGVLTDGPDG